MTHNQEARSGFTSVDATSDPSTFVQCLYNQHATAFSTQYRHQALTALDLAPGQTVLDVGCGLGQDAAKIAAQVGGSGKVTGLDYSQTMVDEATSLHQESSLPLTFCQGDVHALHFEGATFDRCLAIKTFQHLPKPRQALKELVRVTKPGGKVVIAEPDHELRMVDSPYKSITRRFLQFRADTLRQSDIAHRLYAMYQEEGLVNVKVSPVVGVLTDLEEANSIYQFDAGIQAAARYGAVTEAEAEQWIDYMMAAGENGRFLSIAIYLVTSGQKP